MDLIFKFKNYKDSPESFAHVFIGYYEWFKTNNPEFNVILEDVSFLKNIYAGENGSGYFLTITNPVNKKYIVVSYWDKSKDLTLSNCGWDYENCVEIICSCGVDTSISYTPFTYLIGEKNIYNVVNNNWIPFEEKKDLELFFRGRMYGNREDLFKYNPNNITDKIIPTQEYIKEISERKINLSLNGVAEICHRDIEIMSTGSVLLRPKLNVKFHNDLIPWVHYIPFEFDLKFSVNKQWEIINNTFNNVKNNSTLLTKISKNSLEWFRKNATIESNIELLKNVINIKKIL